MLAPTLAAVHSRALVVVALAGGCSDEARPVLSREELLDPATCSGCHPQHYREWSGSMHAYSAQDPVFRAMNARGQRETGGALGDFCVRCHAPLAVAEGATSDGLDLDQLAQHLQGVTCYFCHAAEAVDGDHNNPIRLANDQTMRGGIRDPVDNDGHHSAHSPLVDRRSLESARACGSCHDIVLPSPPAPAPLELERTFREWQESLFNRPLEQGGLTCGGCHMRASNELGAIATGDAPATRRHHAHTFQGVDLALTDFPEKEAQLAAVTQFLDTSVRAEICVEELPGAARVEVTLENVAAGHRWPSGAAQDRRAWVELTAWSGEQRIYASGVVADGEAVTELDDPDLWLLHDRALGEDAQHVHMFWEVAAIESHTLPAPLTTDKSDPDYFATHVARRYPRPGASPSTLPAVPDRVSLRLRVQPMGLDVLDDLIASGDLDPALRDEMPTLQVLPNRSQGETTTLEWTPELASGPPFGFAKTLEGRAWRCVARGTSVRPL
jgi:hypothetical protein